MADFMNKVWVGLLLAMGLVTGVVTGFPVESAGQEQDLYSMTSDQFFRMERVQQSIEFSNIDQPLLSAAVFHETNRRREKNKLPSLMHVPGLEEASRMHARDMAKGQYLSHMNPDTPKRRSPLDRVQLTGLEPVYVSENVATHFGIQYEPGTKVYVSEKNGEARYRETRETPPIPNHTYQTFAQTLVEQWMNSKGHRRNILSEKAGSLGAACEKGDHERMTQFYCVQVFGGNAVLPASESD